MAKIREIHELLQNTRTSVSEKLEEQKNKLDRNIRMNKETEGGREEIIQELKESFEHTEGQLYETNYILDNFWNIISK